METHVRLLASIAALLLGAAAPGSLAFNTQLGGDPSSFAATEPSPAAAPSGGYEPAPVPDADIARPRSADDQQPDVAPSLFNTKSEYSGAGYTTRGASAEGATDGRRAPGVGLNVSVPVE